MSYKNTLIKGTLILTAAGILSRILGFYNRIFLSRFIGAKEVGIYQLIFPLYLLSFSICCQGIQTALSRMIAAYATRNNPKTLKRILYIGGAISLLSATVVSVLLFTFSKPLSIYILKEPNCSLLLKIASTAIPFVSIKACLIGYELGLKRSFLPATTQLMEQIIRVGSIYLLSVSYFANKPAFASIAVLGLVLGEIGSCLYLVLGYLLSNISTKKSQQNSSVSKRQLTKELVTDSIPLTSNRLILTLLESVEAILIPIMLAKFYGSRDAALQFYGILTGMVMPFIYFPSAITSSLSTMLLPTISSAKELKQQAMISSTSSKSIQYSLMIGIMSTFLFLFYGKDLGRIIFNNKAAGEFLFMLACLCPFIYLTSTLSSILNGLGKMKRNLIHNVMSSFIHIFFVLVMIPIYGVKGYLWGLLVSDLFLIVFNLIVILKETSLEFDAYTCIIKPAMFAIISGGIAMFLIRNPNNIPILLGQCAAYTGIFMGMTLLFSRSDL